MKLQLGILLSYCYCVLTSGNRESATQVPMWALSCVTCEVKDWEWGAALFSHGVGVSAVTAVAKSKTY